MRPRFRVASTDLRTHSLECLESCWLHKVRVSTRTLGTWRRVLELANQWCQSWAPEPGPVWLLSALTVYLLSICLSSIYPFIIIYLSIICLSIHPFSYHVSIYISIIYLYIIYLSYIHPSIIYLLYIIYYLSVYPSIYLSII